MSSKFPMLFDNDPKTRKERLIRFGMWVVLMLGVSEWFIYRDPRHAALVPCCFIALIWPVILMPLRKKS